MIRKVINCKSVSEARSKGLIMIKQGYKFNDSSTNLVTKVFSFIVTKDLKEKISFVVGVKLSERDEWLRCRVLRRRKRR